MINLDQVKLLESKVAKAVDYIERLSKDNAALRQQGTEAKAKITSYQKQIEELEVLLKSFKEDQSQIEEAILATLDKLSHFEKAMEKSLHENNGQHNAKEPVKAKSGQTAQQAVAKPAPAVHPADSPGDIPDPLGAAKEDEELDIF